MNVSTRKLSDLKLTSDYLRLDTDVSALMKSIESVGLIHPLTINPDNELLAGARRYQAITELGWTEAPVHVVDRNVLVEELISIDENLVRKTLTTLELERSLNRGREIYESLNPQANKVDLSAEEPTGEERQQKKEREDKDEDSFAAITAEKTGLSKAVISGAIKRDALASEAVKKARDHGDLNATKTNEIIKLEKDVQAGVLPLIADKTAKETRRIVAAAKVGGLSAAQEESEKVVPVPREYRQMLSPIRRVNKSISRILLEELRYDGPEQKKINDQLRLLKDNLVQYFKMMEPGAQVTGASTQPAMHEPAAAAPSPPPSSGADDQDGMLSASAAG